MMTHYHLWRVRMVHYRGPMYSVTVQVGMFVPNVGRYKSF